MFDFVREKLTPDIRITNVSSTVNSISFDLTVFDRDNAGFVSSIELFCGNHIVQDLDTSQRTFLDLLSDTEYQIRATYSFDLNDDEGEKSLTFFYNTFTQKKITPKISIVDVVPTQHSCSFEIVVADSDKTGNLHTIELYKNQQKTDELFDLNDRSFCFLLSDNHYVIAASYIFDLNDGKGEQIIYGICEFNTLAKQIPSVFIYNVHASDCSATFDISIKDEDNIGEISLVELFKDGHKLDELNSFVDKEFNNLLSNSIYTISVTYTYDLHDGDGTKSLTSTLDFKTQSKKIPSIKVLAEQIGQTYIKFDVDILDNEGLGQISDIELFKDGKKIDGMVDLDYREFDGLLSNNDYNLAVSYTYDMDDGEGDKIIIGTLAFKTLNKQIPCLQITDVVTTQNSIDFDIEITDVDQIGSIVYIELFRDGEKTDELSLISKREFTGLFSGITYQIAVTYAYDLNDGEGERLLATTLLATTLPKAIPTLKIIDVVCSQDSLSFDIEVIDVDGVGKISAIELFRDGEKVDELIELGARGFYSLYSNNEYYIKVTYSYDLDDSKNTQLLEVWQAVTTQGKALPIVKIINTTATKEQINFGLSITDSDSVGELDRIELLLEGEKVAELLELSETAFKGLLSGNDYTIRAIYSYDLDDGEGERTLITDEHIKTINKNAPSVWISDIKATADTITYKLNIDDKEKAGQLISIDLYRSSDLIEHASQSQTLFKDLTSYTLYSIIAIYAYDLGDGEGEQIIKLVEDIMTYPRIGIKRLPKVLNPTLTFGEMAFVELGLANPSAAKITKAKINGKLFAALNESSPTNLIVGIIVDDGFSKGKNTLTFESIYYDLNGAEKCVEFHRDSSFDIEVENS